MHVEHIYAGNTDEDDAFCFFCALVVTFVFGFVGLAALTVFLASGPSCPALLKSLIISDIDLYLFGFTFTATTVVAVRVSISVSAAVVAVVGG